MAVRAQMEEAKGLVKHTEHFTEQHNWLDSGDEMMDMAQNYSL